MFRFVYGIRSPAVPPRAVYGSNWCPFCEYNATHKHRLWNKPRRPDDVKACNTIIIWLIESFDFQRRFINLTQFSVVRIPEKTKSIFKGLMFQIKTI